MKFPKTPNTLILLAAGCCLLVTMTLAQGRGPGGPPPPPHGGGRLPLHLLNLTDAQKAQVKAIHETEGSQAEPLRQNLKEAHEALEAATAQGRFEANQVRELATAIAQNEVELTVIRARVEAAIYQVLTAEQRAKLEQLRAEHKAREAEHPAGGSHGRSPRPE
jgi:Spy/CpxP family protein refolding chaperone